MKPHQLRNLAVIFRTNSPDIEHCTTLDAMTEAGLAYTLGLYRGTPRHHKQRRARLRERIATILEQKATIKPTP